MTSLAEGTRTLVARSTDLTDRVQALDDAVNAARGHLDGPVLDQAAETVARAHDRLRLSPDHTVVALAGATGSGKSSTFNALAGLELASVGVRRPTTSWATACTWGPDGAADLLEWLGIPPRHQVVRDSLLDTGREGDEMRGLVLLDLPDHDSTEVAHHLEVDRLVKLADLLVWVLDPQKYADAAVHDRFLRPLAAHRDVMVVVLNHIDEVPEDRRQAMVADLRRLLDADGLTGITLIPLSAREGIGVEELRSVITQRVADKALSRARTATAISESAAALSAVNGDARVPQLPESERFELRAAIAEAAGVSTVVSAVQRSARMRAQRAVGWPPTSWLSRFRPDPLRNLDEQLRDVGRELLAQQQSADAVHRIQGERVDGVVRDVVDRLGIPLARPWAQSLRRAAIGGLAPLAADVDATLGSADVTVARPPIWARLVQVLQWALLAVAVLSGLWLAGVKVTDALSVDLDRPGIGGFSLPAVLLAGSLLGGILLALLGRVAVARSARKRARRVEHALIAAVESATNARVLTPIDHVLEDYRRALVGLAAARGQSSDPTR